MPDSTYLYTSLLFLSVILTFCGAVYDKKNNVIEDPALTKLIETPNPLTTWYEFKEMSIWFLLLTGTSYAIKTYDNVSSFNKKQATQLWLINPMVIQPNVSRDTGLLTDYVLHRGTRHEKHVEIDDIFQVKLPNPLNQFEGMGKIQANEELYNIEKAAQHYNWKFFVQGGSPEFAILSESGLDNDSRKELKQRYKQFQGVSNSHKMMILSGGMDVKHIGLTQRDMDFINQLKYTRESILAIFKVPPAKAGILENANYSNSKEQDATYWDNGVDPLLKRFEKAFTRAVIKWYNPDWNYAFDEVIRRDIIADAGLVNQRIMNGTMSPNDGREYLGDDRIKNDPAMETYYLPVNLIPVADAGLADSVGDVGVAPEKSAKFMQFDNKVTKLQLSILRMSRNARRKSGKTIRKEMESFFSDQEDDVTKIFNSVFGTKGKAEENEFIRKIKAEIFGKTADGKLRNSIKKGHTSVLVQAIDDMNDVMETDIDPSTANPLVTAGIGRLGRKVTRVNDATRDDIESQIKTGVDAGESIDKLKKRVEHVYTKAKGFRAEMIACTESALAYDQGSILSYKAAGVKFVDVIGCQDSVPDCLARNVPIDEADSLTFHPNHTGAIVPRL